MNFLPFGGKEVYQIKELSSFFLYIVICKHVACHEQHRLWVEWKRATNKPLVYTCRFAFRLRKNNAQMNMTRQNYLLGHCGVYVLSARHARLHA